MQKLIHANYILLLTELVSKVHRVNKSVRALTKLINKNKLNN